MKDANADTRTPEPSDKNEVAPAESAKKQGKKKATDDTAVDEVRDGSVCFQETLPTDDFVRMALLLKLLQSNPNPSTPRRRQR